MKTRRRSNFGDPIHNPLINLGALDKRFSAQTRLFIAHPGHPNVVTAGEKEATSGTRLGVSRPVSGIRSAIQIPRNASASWVFLLHPFKVGKFQVAMARISGGRSPLTAILLGLLAKLGGACASPK